MLLVKVMLMMSILAVGWYEDIGGISDLVGIMISFGIFAKESGKLIVDVYPFQQLNPDTVYEN